MQEDNMALLSRVAAGDRAALSTLVCANLGLVKTIVMRFRGRGAEYEDLVQIGTIGMIRAARSYDPAYETAFSTYAVPLIIGEIRRFLRDDGMVKVSRTTKRQGVEILAARERFEAEHGRTPSTSELAALCGCSEAELVYALDAVSPVGSLSEPVGEEGAGQTLGELIAAEENEIERVTDRIALAEAIAALSPLQRELVYLRYERELSQTETGELLGMTQVQVSREEKRTLRRLRELLCGGDVVHA